MIRDVLIFELFLKRGNVFERESCCVEVDQLSLKVLFSCTSRVVGWILSCMFRFNTSIVF